MAVIGAGRLGGFHAQKLAARDDVELVAVVDPLPANRQRVAAECRHRGPRRLRRPARSARRRRDRRPHQPAPRHRPRVSGGRRPSAGRKAALRHAAPRPTNWWPPPSGATSCSRWATSSDSIRPSRPPRRRLANPKYIEAVRASGFTFRSTDVGVVLDLMIHDIDLVLSLVRSPLRKVDALGVSVLGGHEDVANARLEFECGCVATLSASRVSYEPVRRMQVWSARAFAAIDFAARTATLVRPSETLLRRQFQRRRPDAGRARALSPALRRRASAARATDASRPSTPWPWNSTTSSSRSARRGNRGSPARRAATPWPWPSRFSPAFRLRC